MAPRWRVAPPRWASLLLLFCCAAFCSCQDGGTALQPRVETDTLLVALVDGSLAALDARSGAPGSLLTPPSMRHSDMPNS